MRNLDAPVAASHRAYAITIGLQDEHGNPITAVEVKFTGFATLGELLTVLEVVRTSDALLQAQAEVMSSTQDEFAANLAGLVAKAAGPVSPELIIDEQAEPDYMDENGLPIPDPYYGLSTVRDENIAPTPGPTKEQIEKALLEAFPKFTGEDAINFRRFNSDGIEVDENGEPVPVDHAELVDSVLRQFADSGGVVIDESVKCERCAGCGQLADSDDQEPWTAWTSLPFGSDFAVTSGMVKPIPCPACNGSGLVVAV